jgi:hypothetical protein
MKTFEACSGNKGARHAVALLFTLFTAAVVCTDSARAMGISIGHVAAAPGGTAVVPVVLDNSPTNLSAFAFYVTNSLDIGLPTVAAGAGQPNLTAFVDDFSNGVYRVTGFVLNDPPISNGVVANLTYAIPSDAPLGVCVVAFTADPPPSGPTGPNPEARSLAASDLIASTGENGSITIAGLPAEIVSQPQSRTNAAGTTAIFSVTVSGTEPLSYQWKKGISNLTNDGNVSGVFTATLTLSNVTRSDNAGSYSVVVTNVAGSATSSNALLIVDSAPVAGMDTFSRQRSLSFKMRIADLLANDTDPDLDEKSFTGVSATSTNGATLSTNSTQVFYLPRNADPTNNVTDSFTYTISDGWLSATGLVLVTIAPDPTNQSPNIVRTELIGDGNSRITFAGIPGWRYCVQRATNMAAPIYWQTLPDSTNLAGANGLWIYTDLQATNYSPSYYRSAAP